VVGRIRLALGTSAWLFPGGQPVAVAWQRAAAED
jgi:hypothetical protein